MKKELALSNLLLRCIGLAPMQLKGSAMRSKSNSTANPINRNGFIPLRLGFAMRSIILLLLSTKILTAQVVVPWDFNYKATAVMGYIAKGSKGQDTVIAVTEDFSLPVKFSGISNLEIDTSAQHYSNILALEFAPLNFTKTFSMDVSDSAVYALPAFPCKQVDLTVDFNYEGIVYLGSVGLNASNGIPLKAGDATTFYVKNTSEIYYVGTQEGELVLKVKYSGRN